MKRVLFLTPLALAATAGCAPAPNQIQNGQWEVTTELVSMDVPGATPEQLQMLTSGGPQVGMKQTERRCYSEAEARTYLQDIRGQVPPTCRVSDDVYAGGVLRTHVSCDGQGGRPGPVMDLNGNFTNTTASLRIDVSAPNPLGANNGPVRRTIQFRSRRLGECTAPATPPGMALPPGAESAPPPAAAPSAPPAPAQAPATGNSTRR